MNKIKISDIKRFSKNYNKDKNNKILENAIVNNGINEVCLNKDILKENKMIFNIELKESKRYDQQTSGRCWCYAGLNFLKYNVAENMNIDLKKLELSANYLTFYDKLEKANTIYEQVLNLKDDRFYKLNKLEISNLNEGGHFEYFKELVKKYGIIPCNYMVESKASENSNDFNIIFEEKIKRDVLTIISSKKENVDTKKLINDMVEENYIMLSKILGEPPTQINLEYYDKNNKLIFKKITPQKFYKEYVTIDLDNYVNIGNIIQNDKKYYKLYYHKYNESILNKSKPIFLNLPIKDLKELAVKQLKDNIPVWFGTEIDKNVNLENSILDRRIYDYESIFNFKRLTKKENLNLLDISSSHAMCFVGVHLDNNKPIRWKVENSWGDEIDDGYLIMNDTFFEDSVMEIAVNKKYLTKKMIDALKQEPISLKINDPI